MIRIAFFRDLRDYSYLEQACKIHNRSFPMDNAECRVFKSFIIEDPNLDEELILFALDEKGYVKGFLIGSEICKEPREVIDRYKEVIWVKDLAADPSLPRDEWVRILDTLLNTFEDIARRKAKKFVALYAYAPYYFMPGVNILYEDYLEYFESRGYVKREENVSYEVNLLNFFYPRRVERLEKRLEEQGFMFRIGREDEVERVTSWIGTTFSPFWRLEALYAYSVKPPTIWIAEKGYEIVGFAVYNRMGRNEFGPIGVDPSKRGYGVGTVLLFKALSSLKEMGFRYAVIPWTSHLFFYSQVPGIERIKHYYVMVKNLSSESNPQLP